MINKWALSNFKSVKKSPELSFAPLTIIAGANSSGKSSIIQSILMIAQTLSTPNSSRALILNGEFVKLGYIDDIIHEGNESEDLKINFEINLKNSKFSQYRSSQQSNLSTQLLFSNDQNGLTSRFYLSKSIIEIENLVFTVMKVPDQRLIDEFRMPKFNIQYQDFDHYKINKHNYQFEIMSNSEIFIPNLNKNGYCSLRHFLPDTQLEIYDAQDESIRDIIRELIYLLQNPKQIPSENLSAIDLRSKTGEIIRILLNPILYISSKKRQSSVDQSSFQKIEFVTSKLNRMNNLGEWIDFSQKYLHSVVRKDISIEIERLLTRKDLIPENFSIKKGVRVQPMHPVVEKITNDISEFFESYLYYLGPLRDDPKLIYNLPSIPDLEDIGMKGEYTAAVLDRFGKEKDVFCPIPPEDGQFVPRNRQMKLIDATVLWLKHMGLANGIFPKDIGKVGVELTFDDLYLKKKLDLTNVGVGVSQILPILTICLLAKKGGTVIIEQPELHLHPKIQSILGDFFLGIALTGTQCIIETHSDRIINRIRRRIAEDLSNNLKDLQRIYFLEKEGKETVIIPVEPNEYGIIQRWPKGFFDEGPEESQMISIAAAKKRELKIKNNE